jgi:hypothetical protein
MTPKPISRKKLTEFLIASKVPTDSMSTDGRYLYRTGRNILADLVLVGLTTGEFDED